MDLKSVILKPGREKSLLRRHPWVFSGAIAQVLGTPGMGETVEVRAAKGEFLAWAAFSPDSQIRLRVWSFDPDTVIGPDFFCQRLKTAFSARQVFYPGALSPTSQEALRLIHAESDGLPGFVLDRYGSTLVVQFLSAGAEAWRETLTDLTIELTGIEQVYERSDVDARELEGLPQRAGPLRGGEPPSRIQVLENDLHFWVDVRAGHKTGYYLDQHNNRLRVGRLAMDREVLDCFAYTGGFSVYALANGAASVLSVDASADSLALAKENVALNNLPTDRTEWLEGDVFQVLRKFRDSRRSFDMIILDPPKFAQTASQVERAARGYKDINLLAFKLLRPGGLLATFSCSGGVSADLFQKIVAGAVLDAGVEALIMERLFQGPDHPVALNFPEGAYLKGLILRVD